MMEAKTAEKNSISKPLVLIIEDEQFLCGLMMKKLELSGFVVRGAFDGEAGIKAVKEQKPDLILLDLLLPGIDGFELLRRFKSDQSFKDIPVIIISNLGEPADIEKAKNLGAAEYIIKANYSPDEIVKKVWEFV